MIDWKNLAAALQQQKSFSDKFFDPSQLSTAQKQEMLKTFVLSLHSEATGIVEAVNYKDHRWDQHPVEIQKILYKTVDAYRYVLAILNLWEIPAEEFAGALAQKDDYLHIRHALADKVLQPGQKIVLFDVDDVLAEFRTAFCGYATKLIGHFVDPHSDEYYNLSTFRKYKINGEDVFKSFVDEHGFLDLPLNQRYANFLNELKTAGYWIQIITARPATNFACFYDTYSWLARHNLDVDAVAFSPEKFKWLSEQSFYGKNPVFAIDDSAKHATEYAKHGISVLVPKKSYNAEVEGLKNITYVSDNEILQPCI